MKHLSFRVIFFCIFLPPVLYIFTIQGLEELLRRSWRQDLQRILVSDTSALLDGRIKLRDQIQQNIDSYLSARFTLKWGAVPRILVRTKTGRLLYPQINTESQFSLDSDSLHPAQPTKSALESLQVAEENLKILEEGIAFSVSLQIPRNTLLANSVLVFYIFLFSLVLFRAYHARARETERLDLLYKQELEAASNKLQEAHERLTTLTGLEERYQQEIGMLHSEVAESVEQVKATEEQALDEIETLERKFQESVTRREEMEEEVLRLREDVERLESKSKTSARKHAKQIDGAMKRFRTLYKSIEFDTRVVEGFLDLQTDLQLKAEEVVHTLNEDSARLSVKRKVFAQKGSLPVFETEFAYRGRIYWKRTAHGKVQILSIGSKNTQARDLAYLKKLQRG